MNNNLNEEYKSFCGKCPDKECSNTLYFFATTSLVKCPSCGQEHEQNDVLNRREVDKQNELAQMVKGYMTSLKMPHKGTEFVRVNGLSNFQCKILSPFLTLYGMDREGNPRLLTDLGHAEIINCGKLLGNRAFQIPLGQIGIPGFGKDISGSLEYLNGFLDAVKAHNGGNIDLIPLHADGDGHCLVHAASRALIGRELFWHGLRKNLQTHLKSRLQDYKNLFKDFHDEDEWDMLIAEADPYNNAGGITGGLGNIHIFALSNTLKRPIMLIDNPTNMKKFGDYSGLFVPALIEPSECPEKSPICIAWSGEAHNHFVPLVPIEEKPHPTIPSSLIPNLWGVSHEIGGRYLEYNADNSITIGKGKQLKISYLIKLAKAMESVFLQHHEVSSKLVEDFYQFVYFPKNFLIQPHQMTSITKTAFRDGRIRKCLDCKAIMEVSVSQSMLKPGGELYDLVTKCHQVPKVDKKYTFQSLGVVCVYNKTLDRLEVDTSNCAVCKHGATRQVMASSNFQFSNGDATDTPSTIPTKCNCKFKHYWDGKEYDNIPEPVTMTLQWKGNTFKAETMMFYGDENTDLNSQPLELAKRIVKTHFPEDSDTEKLVEQLSDCLHQKLIDLEKSVTICNMTGSKLGQDVSHKENEKQTNEIGSGDLVKISSKTKPVVNNVLLHGTKLETSSSSSFKPSVPNNTPSNMDGKVLVKISTSDRRRDTFKIVATTNLATLKSLVSMHFKIPNNQQILKYGYPPKALTESESGEIILKNGDQIKVEILPEKMDDSENKIPTKLQDNGTILFQDLNEFKLEFESSGFTSMWDYCCTKPHLFLPGGVFYRQFEADIGLRHGNHCTFPMIPDKRFQYNSEMDRVELCLEPAGHYPVDSKTKDITKVISQESKQSGETDMEIDADNKQICQEEVMPVVDKQEKIDNIDLPTTMAPSKIAPGYFTVNTVPALMTAEEIDSQREEILKTMKNISKAENKL